MTEITMHNIDDTETESLFMSPTKLTNQNFFEIYRFLFLILLLVNLQNC